MIINGVVKEDKLFLTAASKASALAIRNAIAGKNTHLSISPYGNQVEPALELSTIIFRKYSGKQFTYEEVQSLLRKIELLHQIDTKTFAAILEVARRELDAQLTFFYPNQRSAIVEVSFCYNWATLLFNTSNFTQLFPEVRDALAMGGDSSLKVYFDNSSVVSVHNFTLNGIYINRKSFTKIAQVLAGNGIIPAESVEDMALRSCAFGLRSVIYMEGRQHSGVMDETFSLDTVRADQDVGNPAFLGKMNTILKQLASGVGLAGLYAGDKEFMVKLVNDPQSLEGYSLLNYIKLLTRRFLNDYQEDIKALATSTTAAVSDLESPF